MRCFLAWQPPTTPLHFPLTPSIYPLPWTQEEFKPLAKWWKEALGSAVEGVKVSKRLATTPCVVVSSKVRPRHGLPPARARPLSHQRQIAGLRRGCPDSDCQVVLDRWLWRQESQENRREDPAGIRRPQGSVCPTGY